MTDDEKVAPTGCPLERFVSASVAREIVLWLADQDEDDLVATGAGDLAREFELTERMAMRTLAWWFKEAGCGS